MQTKDDKMKQELKLNQNLIFNELSRFVNHFINLSLPYELANECLLDCCEQYQLEKNKAHILLTELRSNQKNTSKMFTD